MQQTEQSTNAPRNERLTPPPVLTVRGKPVRPWVMLAAVLIGFFMAILDTTIVNIAIPSIQTSLKADLTSISWVLNAYNLVYAVFLVTAGRFADQYGRKRMFMIGMILFSLGSLGCALVPAFEQISGTPAMSWLIGFRALQGSGAAALVPASLAIILAVFPPEKRGAALGAWGALAGLAAAIGPVIGGSLIQTFGWPWIFFVNLPICLVGLVMLLLFVPETRDPHEGKRIDVLGMLTLTAAIFCLVLAIIQGNDWNWTSTPILALFGAALASLLLFVIIEVRQQEPIVDFSLFKARSFTGANITMFLVGIAVQGAILMVVLYYMNALAYSQLNAAYALLPLPLASFVVSVLAGRVSGRFNPHIMGLVGLILLAVGFGLLCLLSTDASYLDVAWRSLLLGAGIGMVFQSQPSISLSKEPRSKLGVGSGIFNTFRQIGFVLGVAILISVFTGQLQSNLGQARTHAMALVQADTKIPPQMRSSIAFHLNDARSTGSSSSNVDVSSLADTLPPTVPARVRESVRSELRALGASIGYEFKTQLVDSFKTTWAIAALFAIAGFFSAFFTYVARRPG